MLYIIKLRMNNFTLDLLIIFWIYKCLPGNIRIQNQVSFESGIIQEKNISFQEHKTSRTLFFLIPHTQNVPDTALLLGILFDYYCRSLWTLRRWKPFEHVPLSLSFSKRREDIWPTPSQAGNTLYVTLAYQLRFWTITSMEYDIFYLFWINCVWSSVIYGCN